MIIRERQKTEAIERMKMLGLMKQAIADFEKEDKVNLSEHGGYLYRLDDEEKKMVSEFESKYNALVYHVIKTYFQFGQVYDLLYVSNYENEWELEQSDLKTMQVLVYSVNVSAPECSEFGYITIEPNIGGLKRIS